jgi:hypothetical protein
MAIIYCKNSAAESAALVAEKERKLRQISGTGDKVQSERAQALLACLDSFPIPETNTLTMVDHLTH